MGLSILSERKDNYEQKISQRNRANYFDGQVCTNQGWQVARAAKF
jgi:hypothetical protein